MSPFHDVFLDSRNLTQPCYPDAGVQAVSRVSSLCLVLPPQIFSHEESPQEWVSLHKHLIRIRCWSLLLSGTPSFWDFSWNPLHLAWTGGVGAPLPSQERESHCTFYLLLLGQNTQLQRLSPLSPMYSGKDSWEAKEPVWLPLNRSQGVYSSILVAILRKELGTYSSSFLGPLADSETTGKRHTLSDISPCVHSI